MRSVKHMTVYLMVAGVAAIAGCSRGLDGTDAEKSRQVDERYLKFKQAFPNVRDVSASELVRLRKERAVVIVDVRPDAERSVSMIPDAVSQGSFEAHRDQYRDRRIVTYCTIGARSGHYAAKLQSEGFDVVNLRGSILAWAHAGQLVADKDGPTNRVHVYSANWNLLPAGYEAVW